MREKANLKQTEAAEKLGVAQSTISMWENDENLPQAKLLPLIASLYNCAIEDLYGRNRRHSGV